MKNIKFYDSPKYKTDKYTKVGEHIYKTYDDLLKTYCYVTSLSFEQEANLGEGKNSKNISQYPLEDILDKYMVAIEDFYEELNDGNSNICTLEFSGTDIKYIENLINIVGCHVHNKEVKM